jgi:predicted permease
MPDWKSIVRQRLQSLRMTAAAESDLADELAQHLEDQYRELLSGGASPQSAAQQVLAELDDTYPAAGVHGSRQMPRYDAVPPGDVPRGNLLADVARDLRYAVRNMRRSPGFVLVVVLTLALGIGANTTVFTVINTLILNPLPVRDPASLAAVSLAETQNTSKSGAPLPISYPDLKDYQARNGVFQSLAGYSGPRLVTWQEGASASQRLFCELATGNYFATAGITPAKGRFFSADEDGTAGARPVVVVNYGSWQTHFGGAEDIVGKTLRLNHIVFTVVGVAPPKFIGINGLFGPDLWVPAAMAEQLLPNEMNSALTDRSKAVFQGIGRLRPGISLAQAQANLATIAAGLAREFPATDEGRTAAVLPVREALFSSSTGSAAPVMFGSMILFLIVGIVLLIACSNVANLLLARSAGRQQEMAVRLAMGASRRRLARQLLTESVFLGLLGGAVGLVVGYAGLQLVFGMLPGSANFISPKLDLSVLLFALLVSLATGLLFGSIPAIKASRASVADALKEESRTTGRSRHGVSVANALLVTQVAFSFLLLVTAALFLRSIGRAYGIDPGFQTGHLAIFMTNPGQAGYAKPRAKAFYKDAAERVARLPGVESVSWSFNQPLWARSVSGLQIDGREQRSRTDNIRTIVNTVAPKYFETAGVTLEQGREFTDADRETSTPVVIVNEKLAQDYWPGTSALGKRVRIPGEKQMRQIVGIARNANYSSWAESPQLCVYVPLEQNYSDAMTLYARSKGDPGQLLVPVEREIKAAGPQILVGSPRTGRQVIDGGLFQARTGVTLLTVFGLLALGLASIGLYGILAYSVNQRKREIGLRMALGAAQGSVLRLILKQGMTLVLAGMAIGFAAALVAGRLLSRMLFGVGAGDPLSMAAAALVLLAVALWACYLPARRASRVDPLVALREG